MSTIPITKRGAEKLKDELHRLKTVDRPGVIQAIAGDCLYIEDRVLVWLCSMLTATVG